MPYFCLQLKEKIEKLEKANLAKKPWQMSGEAGGNIRPINSLLEEDVSFDHTTTSGKKCILHNGTQQQIQIQVIHFVSGNRGMVYQLIHLNC